MIFYFCHLSNFKTDLFKFDAQEPSDVVSENPLETNDISNSIPAKIDEFDDNLNFNLSDEQIVSSILSSGSDLSDTNIEKSDLVLVDNVPIRKRKRKHSPVWDDDNTVKTLKIRRPSFDLSMVINFSTHNYKLSVACFWNYSEKNTQVFGY